MVIVVTDYDEWIVNDCDDHVKLTLYHATIGIETTNTHTLSMLATITILMQTSMRSQREAG